MSGKRIAGLRALWSIAIALMMLATGLATGRATATELEFRQGFDVFTRAQSSITAFHSLSMLREIRPGLFFGQSLYSAAGGNGGGLFIGGVEVLKRIDLSDRLALEIGGFVGGGGGASVVTGDGLMTRANVSLATRFGEKYTANIGLSYIHITGSAISTPALSFGISQDLNYALRPGHHSAGGAGVSGIEIASFKPLIRTYFPQGSIGRSGRVLNQMYLLGAEVTFANPTNQRRETFMRAAGAVAGDGEGYAEFQLGYRWHTQPARFRVYGEVGAGFAGGGNVDTGGGLIASAGLGFSARLFRSVEAELGVAGVAALEGDFRAVSAYARAVMRFGGASARTHQWQPHWQLTLGAALQVEHPGYRRPSTKSGSPLLAETTVDLFLTDNLYLTGNAQTVMLGDAGGYAVGQFGLGYEFDLNPRWTLSGEVFVGAAAGGGIDTGGGLIAGGKLELDYALNQGMKISAGVGKMLSRGGANPVTVHLGLKLPFTTYH